MPDAKKYTSLSLYTMDDGQLPMEEIPIIHFQEGKEVEHLWMMSGKEALRFSKEKSGLTQNDIAKKLGVSLSVVNRYFNKEDSYLPSLEMIPRLCDVLGNDFLLHWMDIQLKKGRRYPSSGNALYIDKGRNRLSCFTTPCGTERYNSLRPGSARGC